MKKRAPLMKKKKKSGNEQEKGGRKKEWGKTAFQRGRGGEKKKSHESHDVGGKEETERGGSSI